MGDEEGGGDRGNMARNNNDGLVPVVVQQAVLYSASASIDNVGDDKSTGRRLAYALCTDDVGDDRTTTTTMTATSSCRPLIFGVTMIKPTTSYLFFFFFATTGFVLAVAFKNNFLGGLPALPKKIPKLRCLGRTSRNANNVIRPPPPDPPPRAMIIRVFIPLWRIRRCSRTGATLARATALPDVCLGVIFT